MERATAGRIERARVQHMAYEVVNAVSFGPITVHHLDIVNAGRPDSAPIAVPDDNTTTQAMELDNQREHASSTWSRMLQIECRAYRWRQCRLFSSTSIKCTIQKILPSLQPRLNKH
ncbi:hypothetical protein JG688_00008700 [Phytophthora aleatoria]|uniref:Uncharacterized protein n=1 Tax=Phytophthora aleatoria TaxID=2496075 RepID=A0A8J5IHQ7_9STRA|nr:hypothetical protein JG688_00008700 [Phytophthora aleatoria]